MKHRRTGYSKLPGEISGYQTYVTEDSYKGLPADTSTSTGAPEDHKNPSQSEPRERALPAPESVQQNKTQHFPYVAINGPGADGSSAIMENAKVQPRTRHTPGEEYGHPVKEDYLTPTRRVLTSAFSVPTVVKQRPDKKQRRQKGMSRVKARRKYQANRARVKQRANLRYKKLRNNPTFKKNQSIRHKNPRRFRRKRAELLTAPEILFIFGRDWIPGHVRSISPLSYSVTFYLEGKGLRTLPVEVFMASVVFLSEQDIDSFFEFVDMELGLVAYEDDCEDAVQAAASFYGITLQDVMPDCNASEEMTPEDWAAVMTNIEEGRRHSHEPPKAGDGSLIDPTDDDTYFGEVNIQDEIVQQVASRVARKFFFR